MNHNIGIICLALFLITVGCTSESESDLDPQAKTVDKLLEKWDKPDFPGAAVAVLRDGEIIYKQGYGSAQIEYEIPITPETIFHVASVSKQFTAFAIAMLADEEKLSINDDIRKYLPEVPDFEKTITIRHLVHHTSGLRDQWEALAMAGWRLDDVITREQILTMVRNQKELNFSPGEKHVYCNTGYTLLAKIVARVSGQSFPAWTHKNIFEPLKMENTHFHDNHQMVVKNRAYSYAPKEGGGFEKRILSYANVGATSLFTTVEDLLKWADNFYDNRVGGQAVLEQMGEQCVLNNGEKIEYSFALWNSTYRGLRMISHSGGDAGFRSHLALFPDQKFAVVVLSNLGTINTSTLARQVAEVYLGDLMEEERQTTERSVARIDPSVYEIYEGKYQLEDGKELLLIKEDSRLMMIHPDFKDKVELFPEAMARFFLKDADVQLRLQINRDGRVERLLLNMNGKNIPGKMIQTEELDSAQIQELVGQYYSIELDTRYRISEKEGNLVALHFRHGEIPLVWKSGDLFFGKKWFFKKVKFTRNKNNKIDGFLLSGGRVRNLRFIKQ
ncbi:MAG: serine hydrolase [Candidatus Aminicenantes bacterium]|nr:serine hydrolase [Candidatus Aminicenantes bacterium]